MLVEEYTTPLTVEMLLDIVESQRCLWGDKQLVTMPELDVCVELFANDQSVIRCMDNSSMIEDKWTLNHLAARLKNLPPETHEAIIRTPCEIDSSFQVGFHTEEGFIELLDIDEIEQD